MEMEGRFHGIVSPKDVFFFFSYPDVSFLGAEISWIQLAGDGLPANGASNQRPGAGKMGKLPAIQNLPNSLKHWICWVEFID